MGKQHGIILKNHLPLVNKCSIFDNELGKIDGNSFKGIERLAAGTVIYYSYKNRGLFYELYDIEIVTTPLEIARKQIYFLHHILEICYFFLPYESCNKEAFCMIELILQNYQQLEYDWFKKIFLLQLFSCFGMYPDETLLNGDHFKQFLTVRILPDNFELDYHTHQALVDWLVRCLASHPQRHLFKTLAIGIEHEIYQKL